MRISYIVLNRVIARNLHNGKISINIMNDKANSPFKGDSEVDNPYTSAFSHIPNTRKFIQQISIP
jgi:hypothetical protein